MVSLYISLPLPIASQTWPNSQWWRGSLAARRRTQMAGNLPSGPHLTLTIYTLVWCTHCVGDGKDAGASWGRWHRRWREPTVILHDSEATPTSLGPIEVGFGSVDDWMRERKKREKRETSRVGRCREEPMAKTTGEFRGERRQRPWRIPERKQRGSCVCESYWLEKKEEKEILRIKPPV